MNDRISAVALKLLAHCEAEGWAGWEPYDALNSKILSISLLDTKLVRLVLTQAMKRSPINLRRMLLIPKTQNPKALAVFLTAFMKLADGGTGNQDERMRQMVDGLVKLRTTGVKYWCWGYNFPWQTRFELVPRWEPNLVCTAFAANALLDYYDRFKDAQCLEMAVSAAEYIHKELYWSDGKSAGFAYPLPSIRNQVHNANFLASALLCRVYKYTGDSKTFESAMAAARYSAAQQHADGGWDYGEASSQKWIDNFHTGYNLGSLRAIGQYAGTSEFDGAIQRGFVFYRKHFFREDGAPRYYHDRTFPIDSHCAAQAILTLLEFKHLDAGNIELAHKVAQWSVENLWDERGYFYFRRLRYFTNRIPYIRWTHAWMLLSLATLLAEDRSAEQHLGRNTECVTA